MIAYHATSQLALEEIMKDGFLKANSYWSVDERIHEYYLETIEDEGGVPVSIAIEMEKLNSEDLLPDIQGLEEPLCFTIGKSEEEIWSQWNNSCNTYKASIDIIGSFICKSKLSISDLDIENVQSITL